MTASLPALSRPQRLADLRRGSPVVWEVVGAAAEADLQADPPPAEVARRARRAYLARQYSGADDRRPEPGLLTRVVI